MIELNIKTRYAETAQDGIIHHSSYIIYYETARIEYLKSKGININDLEKESILCPVVSLEAHYLKPLISQQEILVKVRLDSFSKVRFKILHEIFKEEEKCAYAITSHCFIDGNFKPIPIPAKLLNCFKLELSSE